MRTGLVKRWKALAERACWHAPPRDQSKEQTCCLDREPLWPHPWWPAFFVRPLGCLLRPNVASSRPCASPATSWPRRRSSPSFTLTLVMRPHFLGAHASKQHFAIGPNLFRKELLLASSSSLGLFGANPKTMSVGRHACDAPGGAATWSVVACSRASSVCNRSSITGRGPCRIAARERSDHKRRTRACADLRFVYTPHVHHRHHRLVAAQETLWRGPGMLTD